MTSKYKALLLFVSIALIVIGGMFFFFYRMYQHDMKALEDFVASYETFNKAIADFSIRKVDESVVDNALLDLRAKSDFQLSSLIKNEKKAMDQAREIADLSRQERDKLNAYKKDHSDTLAKEYIDLTDKRKAAYTSFRELGK